MEATKIPKIFSVAALLLGLSWGVPSTVMAGNAELPFPAKSTGLFNGLYIGGQAGMVNWTSIQANSITLASPDGALHLPAVNNQLAAFNALAGLHLGYGWEFGRYYLGGELYGAYQDNLIRNVFRGVLDDATTALDVSAETETKITLGTEIGFGLRSGVLLTPNLMFFADTEFVASWITVEADTDAQSSAGSAAFADALHRNTAVLPGARIGVGIEVRPTERIGIGVSYYYTFIFGFVASDISTASGPGASRIVDQANASALSTQGFLASFSYYLGGPFMEDPRMHDMNTDNFNGFFLGAHGGVSHAKFKQQVNTAEDVPGLIDSIKTSGSDSGKGGAVGGFQMGYGQHWGRYYFGIELNSTLASTRSLALLVFTRPSTNFIMRTSTVTRINDEPGLDLKPGILLGSNLLLYTSAGFGVTKLTLQTTAAHSLNGVNNEFSVTSRKYLMGLRLGFGFEAMLNRNFSLTMGYLYIHYYNSLTHIETQPGTPPLISLTNTTTASLVTQSFLVGLNYYTKY